MSFEYLLFFPNLMFRLRLTYNSEELKKGMSTTVEEGLLIHFKWVSPTQEREKGGPVLVVPLSLRVTGVSTQIRSWSRS